MRYLPLILKNCLRNRRRSFLTISSLAISVCLLGVLAALYFALFYAAPPPGQDLRLVTRHKVSITNVMPSWYKDRIKNVPGVKDVIVWQWFGGWYKNEEREQRYFFPRFAAEADRLFNVYPEWQIPDDQKRAFIADRTGCIIGATVAANHGLKIGDKVRIRGSIFPFDLDLTVRGIYTSPQDSDSLWFQFKYFEEGIRAQGWGNFAGTFTSMVDSTDSIPRISRTIDEMFANSEAPTKTESEYAFGLSFLSMLGDVKLILLSICGAVMFAILLVAANTMAMSVRERVREVGVMKTLGFTKERLLSILIAESLLITLIGAALGMVMAQLLCGVLRQAPPVVQQIKTISLTPPVLAFLLGVALFVGFASSIVPAWTAARTPVLDALRVTD